MVSQLNVSLIKKIIKIITILSKLFKAIDESYRISKDENDSTKKSVHQFVMKINAKF